MPRKSGTNRLIAAATLFLSLVSVAEAGTMWQDYAKLRLVCFWKVTSSESEALNARFPAANRRDVAYEYQEILGHGDVSANLAVTLAPGLELTVQSLLQDDGQDLALITTRLVNARTRKGLGDNHDVARNASGMNYVLIEEGGRRTYVSYACGAYDLPVPASPRIPAPARRPPIE